MKLISILKGTTINASKPSAAFGYLPEVIAEVATRYHFVEFPTDISQLIAHGTLEPESPAVFRHGKTNIGDRLLLIDELQVYANGTVVSTQGPTTDSDIITEQLVIWASERYNLQFESIKPFGHVSNIEVRFTNPLPDLFSPLRELGSAINASLGPFWEDMPPYEMTAIYFGMDPTRAPKNNAGIFRIERRAEMPFEQGLYFSEAAISTDNHLKILEKFERICLEKFVKA
jgi:hypothetical protein